MQDSVVLNRVLLAATVVVHEHKGRCGCVQEAENPKLCSYCVLFFALLEYQRGEHAKLRAEGRLAWVGE